MPLRSSRIRSRCCSSNGQTPEGERWRRNGDPRAEVSSAHPHSTLLSTSLFRLKLFPPEPFLPEALGGAQVMGRITRVNGKAVVMGATTVTDDGVLYPDV